MIGNSSNRHENELITFHSELTSSIVASAREGAGVPVLL